MFARLRFAMLLAGSIASTATAQTVTAPAAAPVEPIGAIIDAFRSPSIVALPDAHGNEQAHAFLMSLIRDPRFAATSMTSSSIRERAIPGCDRPVQYGSC